MYTFAFREQKKRKNMKYLTITFGIAVSLICSTVIYNKVQHNEEDLNSAMVAKTIVETDEEGRSSVELTMVISGNRWIEDSKRVFAYSKDCKIETIYNSRNGKWVAVEKHISSYNNNSLIETVSYTLADNNQWIESGKESFEDLSYDDGMVHDMVFDKNGNLIMSATYKWDEETMANGVSKSEFVYDNNGMPCRHISYNWEDNSWQKSEIADYIYITQRF